MQIIAELEGEGRGAYTGSLGYLDARRQARSEHPDPHHDPERRRASTFRAGAGIVADSDPERELEETRAKARGLLAALDGRRMSPGPEVVRSTGARRAGVGARARPALRRWPVRDHRLPRRPSAPARAAPGRLAAGCRGWAWPDLTPLAAEVRELAAGSARAIVKVLRDAGAATARGYGPSGTRAAATRITLRYAWPEDDAAPAARGCGCASPPRASARIRRSRA